jgi:hypothetical protein
MNEAILVAVWLTLALRLVLIWLGVKDGTKR